MFRLTLVFLVLMALILTACSDNASTEKKPVAESNLTDADVMTIMHCAEMKMDECKKFEGITLNEAQVKQGCNVMPEMLMCEKKN